MRAETFRPLYSRFNAYMLQLVDIGWLDADAQWHYEDVCSPFNRLYFVAGGAAYVYNREMRMELRPGGLYLIPAGLTNHYHCPAVMQKAYFHFNILLPNGLDLFEGLSCCELPALGDEIEQARQLVRSASLADTFALKQLLDGVLARFIRAAGTDSLALRTWSDLLARFFQLVCRKVTARTQVSELARQLGVTPDALGRRFKQETGKTVSRYLDGLLLHQACRMLLATSCSIAEIAEELQFCDPYYFSRYFKSRMQETPTAYRRRLANMI